MLPAAMAQRCSTQFYKITLYKMTQPAGSCFWIPIFDTLAATNTNGYPKVMKF